MIAKSFKVVLCIVSFSYTCFVILKFMYFLSSHNDQRELVSIPEAENTLFPTFLLLVTNAALLSVFILQHSAMASEQLKKTFFKLRLEDIERTIYNGCSAAALHFLITNWKTIPWISLWDIDIKLNSHLWTVMAAIHAMAWIIIYSGCIMLDIAELTGLKQIYYTLSARPPPMTLKSIDMRRFLGHMRHPSFTGFLIIFWVHPLMSIDRLLMAILMTIYMVSMWNIDQRDFMYHSIMIKDKKRQLFCH